MLGGVQGFIGRLEQVVQVGGRIHGRRDLEFGDAEQPQADGDGHGLIDIIDTDGVVFNL